MLPQLQLYTWQDLQRILEYTEMDFNFDKIEEAVNSLLQKPWVGAAEYDLS